MRKWWATKQAAWGEAIVFMAIGGLAAYLKPPVGIPILVVLLILGIYLIWRAYKQQKKQQVSKLHRRKDSEGKQISGTPTQPAESKQDIKEVKIEVSEANSYDYDGDKKCFLIMVVLVLKPTVVPLHLGWLRLVIAGKVFDTVSVKPPLTNKIEHTQQTHELEYEVDVDTFLKGRYVDLNTMQKRPNCWGYISANAGGQEWKSEEFEIMSSLK